jgi:hypothetical protein
MRFITSAAFAVVACASAATAFAQPAHLSDAQFIAANRCLGLMSSKTLGTPDAAALAKFLDNDFGRMPLAYDEANEARDDARRQANRSNADTNARLIAERDGVCRQFVGAAFTAAAAHPAHAS